MDFWSIKIKIGEPKKAHIGWAISHISTIPGLEKLIKTIPIAPVPSPHPLNSQANPKATSYQALPTSTSIVGDSPRANILKNPSWSNYHIRDGTISASIEPYHLNVTNDWTGNGDLQYPPIPSNLLPESPTASHRYGRKSLTPIKLPPSRYYKSIPTNHRKEVVDC